jgi:hypothetical protein
MTTITCPSNTQARLDALKAMRAVGERHTFTHFDVVIDAAFSICWVAQDDRLPEPGKPDPLAEEWAEVVKLLTDHGYHDLGQPVYDTVSEVWTWLPARH